MFRDFFYVIQAISIGIIWFIVPTAPLSQELPDEDKEVVFLIHGLGRKKGSMRTIEENLKQKTRFHIVSLQYPSREGPVDYQIQNLRSQITPYLNDPLYKKYHIVGHSLGGVLGMILWQNLPLEQQGRLVTLGSPFEGSPWLEPGIIRSEILEPFYGSILQDLYDMPALLKKYNLQLDNSKSKMQIAGDLCPWWFNTLGIVYGVQESHDCFVTTHSALAYSSQEKILCPLTHEGLLSADCSLDSIKKWLENDDEQFTEK